MTVGIVMERSPSEGSGQAVATQQTRTSAGMDRHVAVSRVADSEGLRPRDDECWCLEYWGDQYRGLMP
jgi:hypothetical protein